MQFINKKTDYAIRALKYLAENRRQGYIGVKNISVQEAIPYQYLRNIVQKLRKTGVLKTKEGISGGVILDRDPELISLVELMEIFQGEFQLITCRIKESLCANHKNCLFRKKLSHIENMLQKEFEKITIKSLLDE